MKCISDHFRLARLSGQRLQDGEYEKCGAEVCQRLSKPPCSAAIMEKPSVILEQDCESNDGGEW
jgi:hypothetical protein